jgi:hypothetical protein
VTALEKLAYPYHLALARVDLARWLRSRGRTEEAEPLLSAAVATYTELGARPALAALQEAVAT